MKMQVSIEATGPLARRLTVKIPEERIEQQVHERLARLSRDTKIDGFRRGKAPIKVIERRFGQQIRQEVIGETVRSSLREAITSENLRPAENPSIQPLESGFHQGVSYQATFEVYPEIELAPIEKLEVVKPVCEITEHDIDAMVEILRRRTKRWEPADRPAENGDQLDIDFHGTVDGRGFEGGDGVGFRCELGSGRLMRGLEDALVGIRAGAELSVELVVPPEHRDQSLAGRPVCFEIKVNRLQQGILPELDEDFFRHFGVTEGGLERFREQIRITMERDRDRAVHQLVKDRAMAALLEANIVDQPRALVESEVRRLHQDLCRRLLLQGLLPERIESLQPNVFQEEARRRVASGLLVSEIVKTAGLKAEAARVRAVVEEIASSHEDPARVFKWYYEEPNRLAPIESLVLETAALHWVLDRAKVEEHPITFDALMNPGHTSIKEMV